MHSQNRDDTNQKYQKMKILLLYSAGQKLELLIQTSQPIRTRSQYYNLAAFKRRNQENQEFDKSLEYTVQDFVSKHKMDDSWGPIPEVNLWLPHACPHTYVQMHTPTYIITYNHMNTNVFTQKFTHTKKEEHTVRINWEAQRSVGRELYTGSKKIQRSKILMHVGRSGGLYC